MHVVFLAEVAAGSNYTPYTIYGNDVSTCMFCFQLKLPQIQKIMMEFEKQSEIMEMKEEMMNDAIDDAMGDEDDEEEGDAIVSQVLDELGLQIGDQLSGIYYWHFVCWRSFSFIGQIHNTK